MNIKNNLGTIIFFGAAALSLANCGKSNPLERPTAASGTLTAAQAAGLAGDSDATKLRDIALGSIDGTASSVATDLVSGGTMMQSMLSQISQRDSAKSYSKKFVPMSDPCDPTTTPATPIDADGDLIPVTAT